MKKYFLFALLILIGLSFTQRKINWVAIGDSITYLNDHPEEAGNRIAKGYLTLITDEFPNIKVVNQGHNGWTAVNIADKIETLDLVKADVYTVFLGTNDWWQGQPLGSLLDYKEDNGKGTFYGAFRIITDKLKQLNRNAKIIFITPMQRGDFVYLNDFKNHAYGSYKTKNEQSLEQFANAVIEIGNLENISVVDLYNNSAMTLENMVNFKRLKDPKTGEYVNYIYPDYTNIPFDSEKDDYPYPPEAMKMTYDGLHPTDEGYKIIAKMLKDKWNLID